LLTECVLMTDLRTGTCRPRASRRCSSRRSSATRVLSPRVASVQTIPTNPSTTTFSIPGTSATPPGRSCGCACVRRVGTSQRLTMFCLQNQQDGAHQPRRHEDSRSGPPHPPNAPPACLFCEASARVYTDARDLQPSTPAIAPPARSSRPARGRRCEAL